LCKTPTIPCTRSMTLTRSIAGILGTARNRIAGGWAVAEVNVVPPTIVHRDHRIYVHYHGASNAVRRQVQVEPPLSEANRAALVDPPRQFVIRVCAPPQRRQEQARSPVERTQQPGKKPEDDSLGRERAVNARSITPAPAPAPRPNTSLEVRRPPPPPPPRKH
jgi:hypothetical protein